MRVKNWMIRDGLWNSQGLTSTERMVALCLVQYRNENTNECVVAQRLIARRTGLSLRTVNTALASLESKMLVARWPARGDFCQYDFWLPAFNVNSVQPLHTPPCRKPIKFRDDAGCIPAWEVGKQRVSNYPPEDEMGPEEFDELVRFSATLPRPKPITPWDLDMMVVWDAGRGEDGQTVADLTPEQWAQHQLMADLLTNENNAGVM